jgi:hypothetical protein
MKIKLIGTIRNRKNKLSNEIGQALLLVLVLLFVGILIISATFSFIGESLRSNGVYINNNNDLYAAESGVQDAIYNVLNKTDIELQTLFNNTNYNAYDYSDSFTYILTNNVNNDVVSDKVKNIWVPYGITPPSSTNSLNILNNVNGTNGVNLTITGGVYSLPTYKVNVTYNGTATLPILSIGVWLPQGYTYNNGSSQLASTVPGTSEQLVSCAGNEAVIWTFPANTTFQNLLSNSNLNPTNNAITFSITFTYTTVLQNIPDALPWINVTPTSNADFKYSYTWDADIQDFDLISDAGNTEVESNVPKSATRNLGAAINGDYVASGNSLMIMGNGNTPTNPGTDYNNIRYQALAQSSATINSIPSDADVQGAYLYWTGWFDGSETMGPTYGETATFSISIGGATIGTHTLSCNQPQTDTDPTVGGYSYSCEVDVTQLVQNDFANANPNAINYPGNATYTVGPYNFGQPGGSIFGVTPSGIPKTGPYRNASPEGCYAGWSIVVIYSSPETLGHQLYLYDTFSNGASNSDIDPTTGGNGPGGTISGFIVPPRDGNTQDLNPSGTNSQGLNNYDPAATLTVCVGEGDWCYSGDFIAFNAPQPSSVSKAQNINNQFKLWDGVNQSSIGNTYASPNDVWNSEDQTGTSEEDGYTYTLPQYNSSVLDGMDIKTFVILWESGLLSPGATSARIDLPTQTDQWNLVYIILSFRSSVTSGGSISYLIRHR